MQVLQTAFVFNVFLWSKWIPYRCGTDWTARLQSAFGATRLAVIELAKKQSIRLEVYCDSEHESREIVARFGGRARAIQDAAWQPVSSVPPGRPLSVAGRLFITPHPEEAARLRASHPGKAVLVIPAAMAFGTGEHATTAMCLRLLAEAAHRLRGADWDMLDLGTGSGILALAARRLGARSALGLDNDIHAVRTARENALLNGIEANNPRFVRANLPAWPPGVPQRQWAVVTANLFSELLIRLLPTVIAPTVAPGGDLILSGMLASQTDAVVKSVEAAGLTIAAIKRRGHWRALHCQRI